MIYGSTNDYATARSTSAGCRTNASPADFFGQTTYGGTYDVERAYFRFDTSVVPDDATVTTATLRLCADYDVYVNEQFNVVVYNSLWSAPLCSSQEANYDAAWTGNYEGILSTSAAWVSGTCYYLAVAPAHINLTGYTYYVVGNSNEVAGTAPSAGQELYFYTAESGDTARRPQLSLDYDSETPPAFTPPVAAFSYNPASGDIPFTVYFTDTSTAGDGIINAWHWDLGETDASAATQNTSYEYTSDGSFNVTLYVTDTNGQSDNVTHAVTASNPGAPTANFSYTPAGSQVAPMTFWFTDTSSAGDGTIDEWTWNWTDGSTDATTQNASHTFNQAGTFAVTLYITDTNSKSSSKSSNVILTAAASEYNADLPRVLWVQDDEYPNSTDWSSPASEYWDRGYYGNPNYGAVGSASVFNIYWEDLEPENEDYIWETDTVAKEQRWLSSELYRFLHPDPPQFVTLDDGRRIEKPLAIGIMLQDTSGSGCQCGMAYVPGWLQSSAPDVQMPATITASQCYQMRPNYEDADFQTAYADLVADMAAEFTDAEYPNLYVIEINLGIDGESNMSKDCTCDSCQNATFERVGDSSGYASFTLNALDWHNAFSEKIVLGQFIQGDTLNAQWRARDLSNKTVGIKCNGWKADSGEIEILRDYRDGNGIVMYAGIHGFSTGYDVDGAGPETYQVIPTGFEPAGFGHNPGEIYWAFMGALPYHPRFIDIQYDVLYWGDQVRATTAAAGYSFDLLRFARDYIDREVQNTPSVWIVFRDTAFDSDVYWSNASQCDIYTQGNQGNYEYWLTENRTATGSASVLMSRSDIATTYISDLDHPYNLYDWTPDYREGTRLTTVPYIARRTDHSSSNNFISLDIDNTLPASQLPPTAYAGASGVTWYITVTYADAGTGSWALQYYDYYNTLVTRTVTLADSKTWKDASFTINDAYFDGGFNGSADLRLAWISGSDVAYHRVIITPVIGGGIPATPVPTNTTAPTPAQSATPTRTSTATPTLVPGITPTATRTPTMTPIPPTSTPKPTNTPYYATPPMADLDVTPGYGTYTLTVYITDTSSAGTHALSEWHLKWGDGSADVITTTAAFNLNHDYTTAGSFQISMRITDTGGLWAEYYNTIHVSAPLAPVAEFDYDPKSGELVYAAFTMWVTSTSTAGSNPITWYYWDFGECGWEAGAEITVASCAFSSSGAKAITLTVSDAISLTSSVIHYVYVSDPPVEDTPTPIPTYTPVTPEATATPTLTPIPTWTATNTPAGGLTPTHTPTTTPTRTPMPTVGCPAASYVTKSASWSGTVNLSCNLVVLEGVTLTLQPGTLISFTSTGLEADIRGNLDAIGTAAKPITISASTSAGFVRLWGQWSDLDYVYISNMRGLNDIGGAVITHTWLVSNTYGLATMGPTIITSSTLQYNGTNLLAYQNGGPTISYCNILDPDTWNAYIDQTQNITVTYSWWGAATPDGTKIRDYNDYGALGECYYYPLGSALISW